MTFEEMLQADAEFIASDGFGVDAIYHCGGDLSDELPVRVLLNRRSLDSFGIDDGQFRRNRARVRIPRTSLETVVPGKDMIQGLRQCEDQEPRDALVTQILEESDRGWWLLEVMW